MPAQKQTDFVCMRLHMSTDLYINILCIHIYVHIVHPSSKPSMRIESMFYCPKSQAANPVVKKVQAIPGFWFKKNMGLVAAVSVFDSSRQSWKFCQ